MRLINYLFLGIGIFFLAVLILIVLHWAEVSALLAAAGSQILSLCLRAGIMIGAILLLMRPLYK